MLKVDVRLLLDPEVENALDIERYLNEILYHVMLFAHTTDLEYLNVRDDLKQEAQAIRYYADKLVQLLS